MEAYILLITRRGALVDDFLCIPENSNCVIIMRRTPLLWE